MPNRTLKEYPNGYKITFNDVYNSVAIQDPHGGSMSGFTLEYALKSCEEKMEQEMEPTVPVWVLPASKDMSGRDRTIEEIADAGIGWGMIVAWDEPRHRARIHGEIDKIGWFPAELLVFGEDDPVAAAIEKQRRRVASIHGTARNFNATLQWIHSMKKPVTVQCLKFKPAKAPE